MVVTRRTEKPDRLVNSLSGFFLGKKTIRLKFHVREIRIDMCGNNGKETSLVLDQLVSSVD